TLLELNENRSKVNILCIYRSPSECQELFILELENFVTQFKSTLALIGDINIDISKHSNKTPAAQKYLNMLHAQGLFHISDGPTHYTLRNDTVTHTEIDHFFIRDVHTNKWSNRLLHWGLTDHHAQLIERTHTLTNHSVSVQRAHRLNIAKLDRVVANFLSERSTRVYQNVDSEAADLV